MRILYISYDGIIDPIGQSQVIPHLEELKRKGVDIFLISFEKKERIKTEFSASEGESSGAIRWLPLAYHKSPAIPATLYDIIKGFLNGWQLIKNNKIKIVHARGYIAGLIAYLLKKIVRINFIFDMRGFWPEEKVDAGAWKKNGFLYRVVKYLEKKMLLRAERIVVLTWAAQRTITHKYNLTNVSVIPCCVDLKNFSAKLVSYPDFSLPKGRLILAYLGSVGTFYNLEEMIKFFKSFKDKIPEAFFLVLSNGGKEYINNILRKFHIEPDDYLVTSLAHCEVPYFLEKAAFSLIFYQRTLSASGCCPIKFAESLACGVPVILSPGIGDCDQILNEERVGIVLKGYSEEFYEQVIREAKDFLCDKNNSFERCRNTAKRYFSLTDGVEKYFNIYSKLINV